MQIATTLQKLLLVILFLLSGMASLYAQQRYELDSGWICIKASNTPLTGDVISDPKSPLIGYMKATVPGTILTTLLNNKQVPDPFYGLNNELIPDIFVAGRKEYTYWFVKDFKELPPVKDGRVMLEFRGINYSADVYLNGNKLNLDGPDQGMFLRQSYDISSQLRTDVNNRLAVIVYPPDPVGNPNGGQGGDGTIAHSVTNQYVAGWDWIQPVRDRNTGIWDKVFIKKTGKVLMENTHVVTKVPGKRFPGQPQKPVGLLVTTELDAGTIDSNVSGTLICEIAGKKVSTKVTLGAGEMVIAELPEIFIDSPKLWWPNGYGDQPLYPVKLQLLINGKTLSDEDNLKVGLRELKAVWNKHTNSRELLVNGQKIFIKGGNRILSDAMLRFSPERYDAEVRYTRDMNLNLIRVWGGGITERPEFYDACDKYGIMVMQDFWVSGDCNGRWDDPMKLEDTNARRRYPDDHRLYVECLEDQVKMLRNHASLVYWCGGNEITPPDDILHALSDTILPELDSTRFFFPNSNHDSMSLNSGDGPYTIQPDTFFWRHRSFPFNSESGSVGIGDSTSIARYIPSEYMDIPYYDSKKKQWITDTVWKYHKYIGYDSAIEVYGHPTGLKDFAVKAQLVNYNQYRALVEGASAKMWDWYTGTIIWKIQNPWTAMVGQMYDVYLDPNACMWGLHEGSKPVHAMFDPVLQKVMVVNNGFKPVTAHLTITMIDMDGKVTIVNDADNQVQVPASKAVSVSNIASQVNAASAEKGCFLVLELSDSTAVGATDRNVYWLPGKNGNYTGLQHMPKAKLKASISYDQPGSLSVTLFNPLPGPLAFFLHLTMIDPTTGKRILPVFCEDNYFSITGGVTGTYTIEYPPQTTRPHVVIEGWNMDRIEVGE